MKNNPYVGPRPYERRDRHNFFGRDREARKLRSLILSEREVLFCAQSGAGKTSLLNARVIPALEAEDFLVLPPARVGGEVPPGIDPTAVDNVFVFSVLLTLAGEDADPQAMLRHTLCSFLEEYLSREENVPENRPVVLIVDQFEEIFTTHRDRWQEAEGFFRQVRAVLDVLPALGVVLAMREDHAAALDPYLPLFPRRLSARFRMERLSVKGALAAVKRPAENAGCRYDDGVAERLVDDLRRIKVQRQVGIAEKTVLGPFVEAVQLQIVCNQMWENLPEPEDNIIRWEDVEEYGDVDRALTGFYERALTQACKVAKTGERQLRRWFGEQLITPVGTRGLVLRGMEETGELPNAAVDMLESLHIIRAESRAGARWYELAHDRLVEPILTANRIWRAKHTSPLTLAAEAWLASGRDPKKLYKGEQLREAQRQADASPDDLTELEQDFIRESLDQARSESAKRQRLALIGTVGLLVLFIVLTVWALSSAREAAKAQAESEAAKEAIQLLLEQKKHLFEMGWGVIFAQDADPAVREALSELLDHRQVQATQKHDNYYKEYIGKRGYRPGETAQDFLERQGVSIGPVDPGEVPYYLLIVGDPESIPYDFQYQLDVKYAVGRIHFEELEAYENYAHSVVLAEAGETQLPRQVSLFSPFNEGDRATESSSKFLTELLYEHLREAKTDWQINTFFKDKATKAQLARLLGGDETPALVFTAGHGMGFRSDDPLQIPNQGALLCQDWPGPQAWRKAVPQEFYFSADDVDEDAHLSGLIVFSFAPYSAGTPRDDDFWLTTFQAERSSIAPYAFVARLPLRLLGHPNGGALAFVGHIERAWGYSFMRPGGAAGEKEVAGTFSKAIEQLLEGYPVGAAMEPFNRRYAELAADLHSLMMDIEFDITDYDVDALELTTMVTDSRNYVIIGDPAVRLMVAETGDAGE